MPGAVPVRGILPKAWCGLGPLLASFLLVAAPSWAPAAERVSPQEIDWAAASREARALLGDLIHFDTSNPPGNELALARHVAELLQREGIAAEVFEPAPGRGSLVARLRGSGAGDPVLLMAHIDVVGVERDKWTVDPFAGLEKDGYLYGRGAIDDKGMAAAEIQTLLLLARGKVPLSRDVILALNCDEESGGQNGMAWILEHQMEKVRAAFALNEGGRIMGTAQDVLYVGIQNAEKVPYNVKLVARGFSGHASVPRPDNPINGLARALARLSAHKMPVALNPTTRAFFSGIAAVTGGETGEAMQRLVAAPDSASREGAGAVVGKVLMYDSMLRNSISPTILDAGFRANVIPSTAEANLNIRLLPGERIEAVVETIRQVIAEPAVEVQFTPPDVPESPTSPTDTPLYQAIVAATSAMAPRAAAVPFMSTGATDSARLRRLGIPTYGLLPFPLTEEDLDRMHGNDERVPLGSFAFGVEMIYRIVYEVTR